LTEFEGRYELRLSNVLDMYYPNDFFDFSNCAGVLHHTADLYLGMQELARVTKPGGTLYMLINGKGGLIRDITNLLRDKYNDDAEFKFFIDNLNGQRFGEIADWISSEMAAHDDDMGQRVSTELLRTLFDQDLVLTIKDRIAAPVYHEFSEEEIVEWLTDNGFPQVERLSRYPRYQNVRRFLSPFYNSYAHEISKMLFGSGQMGIKAVKDAD
jgi:SAM-dependent methyltransferase